MESNRNGSSGFNKSEVDESAQVRAYNEQLLLFCLLVDKYERDNVLWRVRTEHFQDHRHQVIFDTLRSMYDRSIPIDAVLLATQLDEKGNLEECGGVAYLMTLGEMYTASSHAGYYANVVRDQWLKRQARYSAIEVVNAVNDDLPISEIVTKCESTLETICETAIPQTAIDLRTVLMDSFPEIQRRMSGKSNAGLKTGFRGLDDALGGLKGGEVVVLAARPGLGKSSLAMNITANVAGSGGSVLVCSMEMSKLELSVRLLSAESGVDSNEINNGFKGTHPDDVDRLSDDVMLAAGRLTDSKMFIDDTSGQSMRYVSALARRLKRKSGLDLIVIDYLQLIEPEDRKSPRELQVATISRRVKVLAKQLNVPVILLAQLNRDTEKRTDKRPQLSDLRESGSIEQDADKVCFLYREENPETNANGVQKCEFLIRKNRNGVSGKAIILGWNPSRTQFTDEESVYSAVPEFEQGGNKLGSKTF